MSQNEMYGRNQNVFKVKASTGGGLSSAPQAAGATRSLETFLATGLGSRGGPNKASNKFRRCPSSYPKF
jgi:hypothetical protein